MKNLSNLLPLLAGLFLFSACVKEPEASFTASTSIAEVRQQIKFTNTSKNAFDYRWDFGDGTSSHLVSPAKTYMKSGTYTVTLFASPRNGDMESVYSKEITVNKFPVMNFEGSYIMNEYLSTDKCDGGPVTYLLKIFVRGEGRIVLYNLTNEMDSVYANVTEDQFTIFQQSPIASVGQGYYWRVNSGSGYLRGDTLTLEYYFDDTPYDNDCGMAESAGTGLKQ